MFTDYLKGSSSITEYIGFSKQYYEEEDAKQNIKYDEASESTALDQAPKVIDTDKLEESILINGSNVQKVVVLRNVTLETLTSRTSSSKPTESLQDTEQIQCLRFFSQIVQKHQILKPAILD